MVFLTHLRKMPIRPTNVSKGQSKEGWIHKYAVFNLPIQPTVHRTYDSCKIHVFVGQMGSRGDGSRSKNTPSSYSLCSTVHTRAGHVPTFLKSFCSVLEQGPSVRSFCSLSFFPIAPFSFSSVSFRSWFS